MPCPNLSLCNHLWKSAYSCYRFSSLRKICVCAIIMLHEVGTWPVQWSVDHPTTFWSNTQLFPSFKILRIATLFLLSLPVQNFRIFCASSCNTNLMTQHPMTWLEWRLTWCLSLKSRNRYSDSIFMEGKVAVYDCCNMIRVEVARAPHMIYIYIYIYIYICLCGKYYINTMKVICTHPFVSITCPGTNLSLPLYRLHWYISCRFP